ncbi:MAG TPA: arginine deiminase-related protein [Burkholderiales bacterium]|nr:arginine deiminase-related protein [Burkholderiales bacterium]
MPIDLARAIAEHRAYEHALRRLGAQVRRLRAAPQHPDSVFVEDTAVVLDELAIITRPGAESRRGERRAVAEALAAHRPLEIVREPATLDGGDVLVDGERVYVGRSSRSNDEAVAQLATMLHPLGYRVIPVEFAGCLHLKSAVTRVADGLLLLNPDWVEASVFSETRLVAVDPTEPRAGNALVVGGSVIHPLQFPRTRARLEAQGLRVVAIDTTELSKAEAGVTCCSLIVRVGRR